jgi:NAD-specific glutamate dehydrogenase
LFSLTVWAGAGNTAQHEETEVVGVDGSEAINHVTCLVVVIERMPHVVDKVTEGLSRTLSEHEVVQQGQGASKGPAV